MNHEPQPIFIGDTLQAIPKQAVTGEYVAMLGERYYQIRNYGAMEPFFISMVSSSDHWLFISSTGGLTAGRVSAEQALFPYYTEDKLAENSEGTGSRSIFLVTRGQRVSLWEPFSQRYNGVYSIERNLYKNVAGTAIIFEEINLTLGLTFRYAWRTSDVFGFVRSAWLVNNGDSGCSVELLDGLQNLLPANISSVTQNTFSVLLDAYKRSELHTETGLGMFSLNSTLTDLAEPSESLLTTTVMQLGLDDADYLLSTVQLDRFRIGSGIEPESEIRGQRGAYFVHSTIQLKPGEQHSWHLVADVCQDSAAIVSRVKHLRENRNDLIRSLESDIAANTAAIEKIVAFADGLQVSGQPIRSATHFANVMFNTMRGGIFANQYRIHTQDFKDFVSVRNKVVLKQYADFFSKLPAELEMAQLQANAAASGAADLIRLCNAYLPLSFSRRHGDPSRPWNRFAINIKKEDGSRKLDYEGNWRDIFQNWEALAFSYPEYIESMICTFLNATTADGYNPYRITRAGIDWEIPEPDNPWANIGYWSDHQIIYLQKLMELSTRVHPGKLQTYLNTPMFTFANVPYHINPYADLLKNPYNTIDFDWDVEHSVEQRVKDIGTDGKLVFGSENRLVQASLTEKMLTLLLAKIANFVPEGGIWMNTQRPEWNDANNALVGKGLSVVTLGYLRRYIVFCIETINQSGLNQVRISTEVHRFYTAVLHALNNFQTVLSGSFSDEQRRAMMDVLGQAGSDYRGNYYARGFSGQMTELSVVDIVAFLQQTLQYVEHSLRANRRSDDLYHAYNILRLSDRAASVGHLYEMLEGQASILSSGMLSGAESLALLESLRRSPLYRTDQNSYILYPDRVLSGFLQKNCMNPEQVAGFELFGQLIKANDPTLINRDEDGNYHFNGSFRNWKDVARALDALKTQPQYAHLVEAESAKIAALFEGVFHHNEFTGRSGSFFAYEGLGSIYWHMVSKLLLAVQETILRVGNDPAVPALIEKYADIRKGESFNKSPDIYGAFPTDPYSHTPKGQGARQPGMTGSVKEEILARQVELGWSIENGQIAFNFLLLDRQEFLTTASEFKYWDVRDQQQTIKLSAGSLAFTICQVPVELHLAGDDQICVQYTDGSGKTFAGYTLDLIDSRHIFQRDSVVQKLVVSVP